MAHYQTRQPKGQSALGVQPNPCKLASKMANPSRWFVLLLLFGAVFRLPAQQNEADRKLLTHIRARADNGDPKSQLELGTAFIFGSLGLTKDSVEAVKWLRRAAEQDDAVAQYRLGLLYVNGEGVAKDEAVAASLFRRAAEQGLAQAQYSLGLCFVDGRGLAADNSEGLKWFRRAAAQGHANAQCYVGGFYLFGIEVATDAVEGAIWYRKAAEQGIPEAQYTLGLCYQEGRGVEKNAAEAVKWYRKAADQGLALAKNQLGSCYQSGGGVAKDVAEAAKWYREAADQGQMQAQINLGFCYQNGEGVTKDPVEAVKWYRKAAGQGSPQAQINLGVCYQDGEGVTKDAVEAVKWYRKAAEQGIEAAQLVIGARYISGDGAPKDYVEAYKWLNLAAARSNQEASQLLSGIAKMMTSEQIAEAQRMARGFKPRKVLPAGPVTSGASILQTRPESSGTGFFITEDGHVVTSEHVVRNAAQVRLVAEGGIFSARVLKVDAANDLALLKAEGNFAALPVVSSRTMRLGSILATVGFPNIGLQGFAPKLARGEISSLSGAGDDARCFQISVPVQPGNSGGALVDERGNVVGVVSARLSARESLAASGALPENVNYAVKSSFLLAFLESVPELSAKLKEPNAKDMKFGEVVDQAKQAAVLVLVY